MLDPMFLDAQMAVELPAREMFAWLNLNIAVPVQISNNINVQVCGIGYGSSATCNNNTWNFSAIEIRF